jgi:hypothetical protein
VRAADELRERFGTRAVTRARLLRTGLPAPFERDLGTPVEQRGLHAADAVPGRKRQSRGATEAPATGRDSEGGTDEVDDPADGEEAPPADG